MKTYSPAIISTAKIVGLLSFQNEDVLPCDYFERSRA
jgi:hypothetical protein